jgi:formylglycine-generating enzyme required for sulfatase activity
MLGNTLEWCQDEPFLYETNRRVVEDEERSQLVRDTDNRILRGGSLFSTAPYLRSANRFIYRSSDRIDDSGFRLARTCP